VAYRERISAMLSGSLLGDFFWATALLGTVLLEYFEGFGPNWLRHSDVFDVVGTFLAIVALPVTIGGWLFIWGDNGPPYPWIEKAEFAVGFGLSFYAFLGALVGLLLARNRRWQLSVRGMLLIVSFIAIAIGTAVRFGV
jgi:hypothetical protein